ncbi:hypothetical protein PQX77_018092, partial [Marasmius sp. AFHP31]
EVSYNAFLALQAMLSSKPRKSYEGKVGAIFEQHKIFLTTPNQSHIPPPIFGERAIRFRRDFHFGEEDPVYFPQPFSHRIAHLAVIPHPSLDPLHKHAIAWRVLTPEDFVPLRAGDSSGGLGLIREFIRNDMKRAVDTIVGKVSALSASGVLSAADQELWKNDKYARQYMFGLKCLLARLSGPATFKESTMSFALCQRAYIELVARLSWFQDFLPHVRDPSSVAPQRTTDVVGALTGDIEICERLYRAGIPVWLARELDRKEGIRVDEWITPPPTTDSVSLRDTGMILSLVDASPPHPVVYEGLVSANNHERYRLMGDFLREFSTTNVFIDKNATGAAPASSHPPASGPSRQGKASKKSRAEPYNKASRPSLQAKPPHPDPQKRNKFIDVDSNLMPKCLPAWKAVSEAIGASFEDKMPSVPGLDDGYAVPDPNVIVGTSNESAKVRYVTTTMKLRPLLHYRLRSPTFRPFRTREWRGAIGLEAHPTKSETKTGGRRANMVETLKECLASGNLEGKFDFEDLGSVPVEWKGQRYDQATMPPTSVVQEYLCELFEINFRYELIALDRLVHTSLASKSEREQEVLCAIPHFGGSLIPDWGTDILPGCGRNGFASDLLQHRRAALHGLFTVMEGWNGGKCAMPRPLVDGAGVLKYWERETTEKELSQYEQALVRHYVSSFCSVFGRAPLLPHRL